MHQASRGTAQKAEDCHVVMDVDKTDDMPKTGKCACILYNICIVRDDIEDFLDDAHDNDDGSDYDDVDDDDDDIFPADMAGNDKRNMITRLLD